LWLVAAARVPSGGQVACSVAGGLRSGKGIAHPEQALHRNARHGKGSKTFSRTTMTTTQLHKQSVIELFDEWIAGRRLSVRKLACLQNAYAQASEGLYGCALDTCGQIYCSELDLPPGSATVQVIAALLDHLDPLPEPPRRLVEVTEAMVDAEHIDRETADAFYERAL
jgi:hypothetical protein